MDRDDILKASRKEHKNRDLAELELMRHAGDYAGRVGALACCLLSLLADILTGRMAYGPWVIYCIILGTNWMVRGVKLKRKSDLVLAVAFFVLAALALAGFVTRLTEVAP